jgi:hypothetical protein
VSLWGPTKNFVIIAGREIIVPKEKGALPKESNGNPTKQPEG